MRSLTLATALLFAAPAFAQPAPAFDAASIKPSDAPNGDSSGVNTKPGRMEARNVTLRRLIRGAYTLPEAQVFGGPKWLDELRYNVDAKANGPAGDDDLMLMLQTLLAERFQLKIHRETRQLNGYALVIGKTGFKGQPAPDAGECNGNSSTGGPISHITATSCPVSEVVRKLAECLHQPVADATGIAGLFNFSLDWSPDDIRAKATDAAAAPSLDDVLNSKFGLKLEARKVPIAVIVIDSAAPASAN